MYYFKWSTVAELIISEQWVPVNRLNSTTIVTSRYRTIVIILMRVFVGQQLRTCVSSYKDRPIRICSLLTSSKNNDLTIIYVNDLYFPIISIIGRVIFHPLGNNICTVNRRIRCFLSIIATLQMVHAYTQIPQKKSKHHVIYFFVKSVCLKNIFTAIVRPPVS